MIFLMQGLTIALLDVQVTLTITKQAVVITWSLQNQWLGTLVKVQQCDTFHLVQVPQVLQVLQALTGMQMLMVQTQKLTSCWMRIVSCEMPEHAKSVWMQKLMLCFCRVGILSVVTSVHLSYATVLSVAVSFVELSKSFCHKLVLADGFGSAEALGS
jgi:NAD/NADP transhydrogenase beta subunit